MGGFKFDHLVQNGKMKKPSETNGAPAKAESSEQSNGDIQSAESSEEQNDYERGVWGRKLEFILSVIGYSVGVGNIWRFPYLVMQNGGGAFLIPFFFFLLFCGFPLFFLEVSLGQFSGTSSMYVWKFCPLFKGVGMMMMVVSFVYCWYYIMVLVWVLVYLVNSFLTTLPWSECGHYWNTDRCVTSLSEMGSNAVMCNATNAANGTACLLNATTNSADVNGTPVVLGPLQTASKEFWHHYVLQKSSGLEEYGTIRWHLAVALAAAWIIIFLCLMRGIKSVGKVVYVTALLPYVLLTVFLVKGLTLPGAVDGILFYIKPDFSTLQNGQVWLQAAVQVFYSLGPAWGGLITMASYNKFNNNCFRDALICCAADGFTSFYGGFVIFSVLGYIAKEANMSVKDVATSGPGLALVVYPEAITKLPVPQLWAALFFLMLLSLGIDSQFGVFETLSSGITDTFPKLRKRKILVTACLCCVLFLLDLPYITNGGVYLYQLVDWYFAAFCVIVISFLECVLIGWIYGANRYFRDLEMMLGKMGMVPSLIMRLCWCFITPLALLGTFLIMCYQYVPPDYDGYMYPASARVLGNILAIIPLLPLPVYMLWEVYKAEGSLGQRLGFLIKPAPDWGPRLAKHRSQYHLTPTDPTTGILDTVRQNLLGPKENNTKL